MNTLSPSRRAIVAYKLERDLLPPYSLRPSKLGGPRGLIVPPPRRTLESFGDDTNLKSTGSKDYVLCYNDLP